MALKTSRKKQNVCCDSIYSTSVKSYQGYSHPLQLQEVLSFTKLTRQTLEPHCNILCMVIQLRAECSLSETQLNTFVSSIKTLLGKKSSASQTKSSSSRGKSKTQPSKVIFYLPCGSNKLKAVVLLAMWGWCKFEGEVEAWSRPSHHNHLCNGQSCFQCCCL